MEYLNHNCICGETIFWVRYVVKCLFCKERVIEREESVQIFSFKAYILQ